MLKRFVQRWPLRFFLRKIGTLAVIASALMSAVFVGFSVYGNNVGNFVINIEENTRLSLTLSETGNFEDESTITTLLMAKGLKNATNTTYGVIPHDIDSIEYTGDHNDDRRRYCAYSFYLKNNSPIAVSYSMQIVITEMHKAVDDALRVMIFTNGEREIYAKLRPDGEPEEHLGIPYPYTTTPFVSALTVCDVYTDIFSAGDEVRYTVVLWLEGYDEQCVDDIRGGSIKLAMNFAAYS